jgi:hypothetical protein
MLGLAAISFDKAFSSWQKHHIGVQHKEVKNVNYEK